MNVGVDTTVKTLRTKVTESALALSEALSGCTVLRLSIHDATGCTVWNGGNPLSPDEQEFVLDALDCFALEPSRRMLERPGPATTGLVAFAARDPRGAMHGAMLLNAELATLSGRPGDRQMPVRGERLLRQLALRLGNSTPHISTHADKGFGGTTLTLHVQRLLKLGAAGNTRRFEVLLRSRDSPAGDPVLPRELIAAAEDPASGGQLDRAVVGELCRWLVQNRPQIEVEPAAFSINLSTGALLDTSFAPFVAHTLREARLNPRLVGFEIRESQCRAQMAAAKAFIAQCEENGCHVILDDFTFHQDVLPLLRSRAVRMLKICPALTLESLRDKVSQAQVAAISQGSRVLGIHSSAKHIETPQARQWLAAIGVEFAQGYLFERPVPLAELSSTRLSAPRARR